MAARKATVTIPLEEERPLINDRDATRLIHWQRPWEPAPQGDWPTPPERHYGMGTRSPADADGRHGPRAGAKIESIFRSPAMKLIVTRQIRM